MINVLFAHPKRLGHGRHGARIFVPRPNTPHPLLDRIGNIFFKSGATVRTSGLWYDSCSQSVMTVVRNVTLVCHISFFLFNNTDTQHLLQHLLTPLTHKPCRFASFEHCCMFGVSSHFYILMIGD